MYLQFLDFGQATKCGIHHNLKKIALSIVIHSGYLALIIEHVASSLQAGFMVHALNLKSAKFKI
jgi:hypothetical protein